VVGCGYYLLWFIGGENPCAVVPPWGGRVGVRAMATCAGRTS